MQQQTEIQTIEDLREAFKTFVYHDDYLGYGYLGERRDMVDRIQENPADAAKLTERLDAADQLILDIMQRNQWSTEDLFTFVNSKSGRYFADSVFFGHNRRLHNILQEFTTYFGIQTT